MSPSTLAAARSLYSEKHTRRAHFVTWTDSAWSLSLGAAQLAVPRQCSLHTLCVSVHDCGIATHPRCPPFINPLFVTLLCNNYCSLRGTVSHSRKRRETKRRTFLVAVALIGRLTRTGKVVTRFPKGEPAEGPLADECMKCYESSRAH
jgi:hypothetical protein